MQVVIPFSQGNEWIYGKALKYTQLFFLWAMHCEREQWIQSKIIGINLFEIVV